MNSTASLSASIDPDSRRSDSLGTRVASCLARWFKERGWERRMVAHEMQKLHLSTYLLLTGDLLATSKQAGHATTEMTEKTYVAVLKKHEAKIELPGT